MKTRNITKLSLTIAFIIGVLYGAGCGGGSSAPPVDLPAPITGRIDASAPDDNGNVTITGSEGAVVGGMTVVAVNEDTASGMELGFISRLVPSANAADGAFPMLCSELGHACTVAASDGSFVLVIAAKEGDTIRLGLIDPETGAYISATITITVPSSGTPEPQANCAGKGVAGASVDIAIAPSSGTPIQLKQGSDTTTNQLVIGSSSPATVSITGCYAHSIEVFKSSTGDVIAVTSTDDKILWTARLASGSIAGARSFNLQDEPMHIAFVNLATQPLVAVKTADSVVVAQISLGSGAILATMNIGNPAISGLAQSLKLNVMPMEQGVYNNNYLGLIITNKGTSADSYITVFQAAGLVHKGTWSAADINDANKGKTAIQGILDGALFVDTTVAKVMSIAALSPTAAGNTEQAYNIYKTANAVLLFIDELETTPSTFSAPLVFLDNMLCTGMTMHNLVTSQILASTPPAAQAVISTKEGSLCIDDLTTLNPPAQVNPAWTAGDDIVAIAVEDGTKKIFGADNTTGAPLDGSTYYIW